jgi:hypothetical protein
MPFPPFLFLSSLLLPPPLLLNFNYFKNSRKLALRLLDFIAKRIQVQDYTKYDRTPADTSHVGILPTLPLFSPSPNRSPSPSPSFLPFIVPSLHVCQVLEDSRMCFGPNRPFWPDLSVGPIHVQSSSTCSLPIPLPSSLLMI